jgi:peroxiredoxin
MLDRSRIVKKFQTGVILTAVLAVGTLYAWTRLASEFPAAPESVGESSPTSRSHLASPTMIEVSSRASGSKAPDFKASANDGQTYRLSEIVKAGPAVLIFIKEDCPCSRAAEPFFQRIHAAGRGWVPFYGVIDGGVEVAQRWADQSHSVFPILADPELKIIHAYKAESSAYVAFVGPEGQIEKLWAGYSESMLRELADRMARWVKPGMEPFDVSDAPAELYSGCPY